MLFSLADDQICSIVGFTPDPSKITVLRLDLVSEVIGHILSHTTPRTLSYKLASPDFDEKIQFNHLTVTGPWLRDADYRHGAVEQFFKCNSDFSRQAVRDKLTAIYEDSKGLEPVLSSDGATRQDHQLFHILNQIAPCQPDLSPSQHRDLQNAALVVLAYFFEACDIFEEPTNAATGQTCEVFGVTDRLR